MVDGGKSTHGQLLCSKNLLMRKTQKWNGTLSSTRHNSFPCGECKHKIIRLHHVYMEVEPPNMISHLRSWIIVIRYRVISGTMPEVQNTTGGSSDEIMSAKRHGPFLKFARILCSISPVFRHLRLPERQGTDFNNKGADFHWS